MVSSRLRADVLVIGGGLSGLAAAAFLAKAGRSIRLVERAATVGGRAATARVAGYALNRGPHALYRRGEALEVLRALGVPVSAAAVPSRGHAWAGGGLHRLPVDWRSLLGTRLLAWKHKTELGKLLAALPRLSPAGLLHVSVSEWLEQLSQSPEVRDVLAAFCRLSTYVNRPDVFSAGTALAQVQKAVGGVLYVHGGWQTLADGLASAAEAAGARIECNARIDSLSPAVGGGYEACCEDGRIIAAKAVVLAVAPSAAARLLVSAGAPVPDGISGAVAIRMATLDLALARLPRVEPRFVLGIDQPFYFSVHSAVARLGPEGGALIHIGKYLRGDESDSDADRAELESVLDSVQPGWRKELVHAQYLPRITVASRLDVASEGGAGARPGSEVEQLPGVFLAGDWVRSAGWLADASLDSARATSRAALAHLDMTRAVA
jgi:phytoene dehydrogenase-like protein